MDFSKFSDDNFNMKDWINNALQPQVDSSAPIDAHASNLVMKLQLFIQEVTKSLEETSQIALNNVPRVLREVETIQTEAKSLNNQMISVKGDIEKIEENTAQSMKRLIEVDRIKTRMVNTENALQEAGNWSELRTKVNNHFESGDLNEVAQGLVGMQKSLLVLQHVPDYSERCAMLESLKNRYEAAISPILVKTFKDQNLENAKYFVEVFSNLGRLPQIERYYNKCHKSSLTTTWNEIREDPTKSITTWLPIFHDHLVQLWHAEASWCAQIFPDPVQALCSLIVQILSSLQPSVEACLNDALHDLMEPNEMLTLLIELQSSAKKFVTSLEKVVQQNQGNGSSSSFSHLVSVIWSPFESYLLQYSNLQQTALMKFIDTLKFDSDDLSETSSVMLDSAMNAFKEVDQAVETCVKFTEGVGVAGLIEALQVFFSAYFGLLDQIILEMHMKLENHDGQWKKDDSNNKWTNFQYAFKLIEVCGILSENMVKFKEFLYVEFMKVREDLFSMRANANYLKSNRPTEWDKVVEFDDRLVMYNTQVVLPSSGDNIAQLTKHAHFFAFDIIFAHLKEKIESIHDLEMWNEEGEQAMAGDLPTFSLSPQSYITYVGDSLLTLPEQLEPYFTQDNPSLISALKEGKIPYQKDDSLGAQYDHHWLECFVHGSTEIFGQNILKIKRLTTYSTRQLLADLDYYFNILAALEMNPSNELSAIRNLLEVEPKTFRAKVEELSSLPGVTKSISHMRGITL